MAEPATGDSLAPIMWQPGPEQLENSLMRRFADTVPGQPGDFAQLHAWSVRDLAGFWQRLWDFTGVRCEQRGETVLADGDKMRGARFFPEARLNFAENLLQGEASALAIAAQAEDAPRRQLTFGELAAHVKALAAAMAADGVQAGDRVAGIVPNGPEAVTAALATAWLGATWSSASPDFGVKAVLDRFAQIEPKVLVVCDSYVYKGKRFDIRDTVGEVAANLPSLRRVVSIAHGGGDGDACGQAAATGWTSYLGRGAGGQPEAAQVPFAQPLYVMYSSGTTGKPKPIVHSAGGTLLKHLSEHQLHCDIRPNDRVFYATTCGWMMWNWLVSALSSRAALVLYDGHPMHPEPGRLWDLAEQERVSLFGTAAPFLSAQAKAGVNPAQSHDLSALKLITSTGSPLAPAGFDYVYERVKADVQLASISGGTDILGCFVMGNPTSPVRRGEIQGPALGMAVDVWNEQGQPVRQEKGELVCTKPFPSMPNGFWGDSDGERYRKAYFATFPGIWHHGDFIEQTASGGYVMHGRSDATLKPGGVRIGTAEIYRPLEDIPEVAAAAAVGQETGDSERVVLFVVPAADHQLDEALAQRIREAIRGSASPRHVPAVIAQVSDLPRTKSGKVSELAIRAMVHGQDVGNRAALANPDSLDQFRNHPQLRG